MRVDVTPHGIDYKRAVGVGMREELVKIIRRLVRERAHGFLEIAWREETALFHLGMNDSALLRAESADLPRIACGYLHISKLHRPAKAVELDAVSARHLRELLRFMLRALRVASFRFHTLIDALKSNRAAGDDAVVKARH